MRFWVFVCGAAGLLAVAFTLTAGTLRLSLAVLMSLGAWPVLLHQARSADSGAPAPDFAMLVAVGVIVSVVVGLIAFAFWLFAARSVGG